MPRAQPLDQIKHGVVNEKRVAHIASLMRSMKFVTGVTIRELADEWGLSIHWVKELSAEASKRVRAEVLEPEEVGRDIGVALSTVVRENLKPGGDPHAVIGAAKVWAQISGAMAPKTTEVRVQLRPGQTAESVVIEALWGKAETIDTEGHASPDSLPVASDAASPDDPGPEPPDPRGEEDWR